MKTDKIPVHIKLRIIIEDDGEKEMSMLRHSGVLRRAPHADVLTFEEDTEAGKVRTMVTIRPGTAIIKRTGAVSMHQKFEAGSITENAYQHPHGMLHMETNTDRLLYESQQTPQSGTLAIDYTVKLNGQAERSHELILHYQEEDESQ